MKATRYCAAGLLAACAATCSAQSIVYQRASLGTTGLTSGSGIAADSQFFTGWRFEVSGGPVITSRIGGHFFPGSGFIFGAIVRLTGPNDDPDTFDLTTPDVIGTTLIETPFAGCSCDDSGPLSVTLTDGWYLVIFGSGRFGATGFGPGLIAQDPATAATGSQLNITYRQPSHPAGQGGPFLQGSVGRVWVEADVVGGGPCYANCDGSTSNPVLTANDFQCFLNKYAANESGANCDGSTSNPVLTANDFQCFLNVYAAGCS